MPIYQYSINENKYVTREAILCKQVMGMMEDEAVKHIRKYGCLAFVEQRDGQHILPASPTAHSYRILLTTKKKKVVATSIG